MSFSPYQGDLLDRLPPGDLSVGFTVGDASVRVDHVPVAEEPFFPQHYPGFYEVAPESADLVIDCRVRELGSVLPEPTGLEIPTVTVDEPAPERVVTRSHWHEGEIDFSTGHGHVVLTDLRYVRFRISLENYLRVAFANLLLRRGGCLVHAAGLVRDGSAHVFFGLSGSGKSRVVELTPELPALSDDLISLRVAEGRLIAERVPFFGLFPSTEREGGRYAVEHLLHLVPAAQHSIGDLTRPMQALHLRTCLPFLNATDQRAFDVVEGILDSVPARELRFRHDAGFWDLLR